MKPVSGNVFTDQTLTKEFDLILLLFPSRLLLSHFQMVIDRIVGTALLLQFEMIWLSRFQKNKSIWWPFLLFSKSFKLCFASLSLDEVDSLQVIALAWQLIPPVETCACGWSPAFFSLFYGRHGWSEKRNKLDNLEWATKRKLGHCQPADSNPSVSTRVNITVSAGHTSTAQRTPFTTTKSKVVHINV